MKFTLFEFIQIILKNLKIYKNNFSIKKYNIKNYKNDKNTKNLIKFNS